MSQRLRFTVAFDEADGENIVFFGNYFRLAHRAFEAWLPTRGIAWEEWFASAEYGVPFLHAEADYKASLRPGQAFDVEIRCARVGETSVHFEYEFWSTEGRSLARLKTSAVFVSRASGRKTGIPETLASRLAD